VSGAAVQGEGAPDSLCAAISRVTYWGKADVLIVGRGGGSREDLWAFNDERVARAIAGCSIPTISAVGHEIDTTVCDLVADFRAPTPSAAAESAIPALADMHAALVAQRRRMGLAVERRAESSRLELRKHAREMRVASVRSVEERKARLRSTAGHLNALSPLAVLARGYAVARGADGETLTSIADFGSDREFELMLRDGRIKAKSMGSEPINGATIGGK
jgi:exodeoxyribonuclease VII large subunit